jgi:amino acid transporter
MIACFTENQLQNTEKIILLRSVIVLLSMSPKGKTKTRAIVLSVVICQALVLVLPLGNIVLSVVIYQTLVLVLPFR